MGRPVGATRQFCPREHDTYVVGRTNGQCRECKRIHDRERKRLRQLGQVPPQTRIGEPRYTGRYLSVEPFESACLRHGLQPWDIISGTSVRHYRRKGLSIYRADELACALGMHPSEIWPDWFEESVDA